MWIWLASLTQSILTRNCVILYRRLISPWWRWRLMPAAQIHLSGSHVRQLFWFNKGGTRGAFLRLQLLPRLLLQSLALFWRGRFWMPTSGPWHPGFLKKESPNKIKWQTIYFINCYVLDKCWQHLQYLKLLPFQIPASSFRSRVSRCMTLILRLSRVFWWDRF